MPQAGRSSSLWAPLASSSTPDAYADADIPIDELETSSCHPPEKTPGLSLDDNRNELPAPDIPRSTVRTNNSYEKISSDFYRIYSAHWQFGYDEYNGDSSRTGWEDNEGPLCHIQPGAYEAYNSQEGEDSCVENTVRMASWAGQPDIKGRNETVRMMLLCAVHFGITFTWGVEMTCENPF